MRFPEIRDLSTVLGYINAAEYVLEVRSVLVREPAQECRRSSLAGGSNYSTNQSLAMCAFSYDSL